MLDIEIGKIDKILRQAIDSHCHESHNVEVKLHEDCNDKAFAIEIKDLVSNRSKWHIPDTANEARHLIINKDADADEDKLGLIDRILKVIIDAMKKCKTKGD